MNPIFSDESGVKKARGHKIIAGIMAIIAICGLVFLFAGIHQYANPPEPIMRTTEVMNMPFNDPRRFRTAPCTRCCARRIEEAMTLARGLQGAGIGIAIFGGLFFVYNAWLGKKIYSSISAFDTYITGKAFYGVGYRLEYNQIQSIDVESNGNVLSFNAAGRQYKAWVYSRGAERLREQLAQHMAGEV